MTEEIQKNTSELRSGTDELWVRLRELLVEKGIDPESQILAYSYPEDLHFELGVLVGKDGKIYQYGFDYLHKNILKGTFSEWVDLTGKHETTPYRNEIEAALQMFREETAEEG